MSHDFLDGPPSSLISTLPGFWGHRDCQCEDIMFFICHVTICYCIKWLCGCGPLFLCHHPARLGVHRPYESRYITFLICHVTTLSMCLCGWNLFILNHHIARFVVYRPYGTGNNGVWNISFNSNSSSSSNAQGLMPKFTSGL